MNRLLEIACFNYPSVMAAERGGAARIELCENYEAGGITPSESLITKVREQTNIPVFVMIRPRPGNFCYNETEIEQMKKQILFCKQNNCDGFVFGVLTHDHKVNVEVCKDLVSLASPLPCTFHRAFDTIADFSEAVKQIIDCGFKRILSSGKSANALEGKDVLKQLNILSDNRIIIVAGGGIRSSNVLDIASSTQCTEFHSAAIITKTEFADEQEIQLLKKKLSA